jgi:hypothetical protein
VRATLLKALGLVLLAVAIPLVMSERDRAQCVSHYAKSGLPFRYSFRHGCEVQLLDGRWINPAALL